jgi:hypothetical protein
LSTDAELRAHWKALADADVAARKKPVTADCTRVDGDPTGPGSFAVRSATEPGHVWYVERWR